MPFTAAQLATQMANPNLVTWANSNTGNQAQYMVAFTNYFNGIQTWITNNGGANPFGWRNVTGMTRNNGTQVVLTVMQRPPYNDFFDDTRAHLHATDFHLFQAAKAAQLLITVLNLVG